MRLAGAIIIATFGKGHEIGIGLVPFKAPGICLGGVDFAKSAQQGWVEGEVLFRIEGIYRGNDATGEEHNRCAKQTE